jgi:hypothetical protein
VAAYVLDRLCHSKTAMSVKISRKIPFGAGSRGFRFRNHEDAIADRKQYEEGCDLEEARFRKGSLAQRIYERLSSGIVISANTEMLKGNE